MSDQLLIEKQLVIDCLKFAKNNTVDGRSELTDRLAAVLATVGISIHTMPRGEEWWCPDCKPVDGAGCGACSDYPKRKTPQSAPTTVDECFNCAWKDAEIGRLRALAQPAAQGEVIATICLPDPEDERRGPWFSIKDLEKLESLRPGTQLYTHPPQQQARVTVTDVLINAFVYAYDNAKEDGLKNKVRYALEAVADQLAGGGE